MKNVMVLLVLIIISSALVYSNSAVRFLQVHLFDLLSDIFQIFFKVVLCVYFGIICFAIPVIYFSFILRPADILIVCVCVCVCVCACVCVLKQDESGLTLILLKKCFRAKV